MIYSDTSTYQGILQECESIVFSSNYGTITNGTVNLATFTRYANQALDHVTNTILTVDNRWQYDDTTYTDLPIGKTTLVNGQKDYSLSVTHMKILGVSVKDNSGLWVKLNPIDPNDMPMDRDEYMKTPGMPMFYDLLGNSIFLYPAPATANVTLTAGLKVYYQRVPNYFATTDTTKQPGFPSTFHRLVALWASYFYCQANNIDKIGAISDEIKKTENDLKEYYTRRNKDEKTRFKTAQVNSK